MEARQFISFPSPTFFPATTTIFCQPMTRSQLVLLTSSLLLGAAQGHGFVAKPVARNGNWQGLGGAKMEPATGCSQLGASYYPPVALDKRTTYQAGEVIEVDATITAHHGGKLEFRVQDVGNKDDPDGSLWSSIAPLKVLSFSSSVLDAATNRYKCSFCSQGPEPCAPMGPGLERALRGVSAASETVLSRAGTCAQVPLGGQHPPHAHPWTHTYTIQVKLPDDLHCEHCVMQWYYETGNSCGGTGLACPGSEKFWNCMDVKIKGDGSVLTPAPTASLPTAHPTAPPTSVSSGEEGKCGCHETFPITAGWCAQGGCATMIADYPDHCAWTDCDDTGDDSTTVGDCNDFKTRCQNACNTQSGGVTTNQCWGSPTLYMQCKCSDGSVFEFAGFECVHSDCPSCSN